MGDDVKIVGVETLRPERQRNLCFVRLRADDGSTGLGEAFYGGRAVEAYVHETAAPILLGTVAPRPVPIAEQLRPYVGYQGAGAEMRGNGAIDGALWDLLGKSAGLPLVELLGGPCRDRVRTYNTCAGTEYVSRSTRQHSSNWGTSAGSTGRYEDLAAFFERPGELARELRDEGYFGMKIWPFDTAAERTGGYAISSDELAAGVSIVEQIRDAVGRDIEILIELHGLWNPSCAVEIGRALEPYDPFWIEDPVRPDLVDGLRRVVDEVAIDVAVGETVTGRRGFGSLLDRQAVQIATVDIGWCGGLTEALKIASMADAHGVPIAPHDCTGPVSLALDAHLVCSQPNGLVQETARAFHRTWYGDFATGFPEIVDGWLMPGSSPGHGVELVPGFEDREDVHVKVSAL